MADRIIEKNHESPAAGYFFGIMIVGAVILLVVWYGFLNRNAPPATVPAPTVPQEDSSSEGGQGGEEENVDIDFPDQIDINMNDE